MDSAIDAARLVVWISGVKMKKILAALLLSFITNASAVCTTGQFFVSAGKATPTCSTATQNPSTGLLTIPSNAYSPAGSLGLYGNAAAIFQPFHSSTPAIQIYSTSLNTAAITVGEYASSFGGAGPGYEIQRSHGSSIGAQGALVLSDNIGGVFWSGSDGTNLRQAASITAIAQSNWTTGINPTYMVFQTANASGNMTQQASLGSDGHFIVSGVVSATNFDGPGTALTGTAAGLNIGGTATNLSGTPALPNGTTATTQATADSTTKLATTAFVHAVAPSSFTNMLWALYGSTGTVLRQANIGGISIGSVSHGSTGNYSVNLSGSIANNNYTVNLTAEINAITCAVNSRSVSAVGVICWNAATAALADTGVNFTLIF
jgi:hypothetical protein